jgi:hypothetical protein
MKYYIEAFYADGSQILGNLDGQTVIVAKRYTQTLVYKNVIAAAFTGRHPKVAYWRVVTESGKVLETIRRPTAQAKLTTPAEG